MQKLLKVLQRIINRSLFYILTSDKDLFGPFPKEQRVQSLKMIIRTNENSEGNEA